MAKTKLGFSTGKGYLTKVDKATNADYATSAGSATKATNADYATSAGSAGALKGRKAVCSLIQLTPASNTSTYANGSCTITHKCALYSIHLSDYDSDTDTASVTSLVLDVPQLLIDFGATTFKAYAYIGNYFTNKDGYLFAVEYTINDGNATVNFSLDRLLGALKSTHIYKVNIATITEY